MTTATIFEIIGYVGSALVLVSFLRTKITNRMAYVLSSIVVFIIADDFLLQGGSHIAGMD